MNLFSLIIYDIAEFLSQYIEHQREIFATVEIKTEDPTQNENLQS